MPENLKLMIGKLIDAWRAYPADRAAVREMPAGPPIFVTGTHRSGTTWVAKMLAVRGVWYVHEPFNPNKGMWREAFSYATPGTESPAIDRMMRRILIGGCRRALDASHADHAWMPLRWLPLRPRRVLLKDPLACLLTGYLAQRFGLQTLVIFRHPCGFVSSVMRLGWPTADYLRSSLNCTALMDDHLAPYADLMLRHAESDTIESAAVLHGILNQVLWNQSQQLGLRWCLFEDLCSDPLQRFADIFAWLALPYSDSVRQDHASLCLHGSPRPEDYSPHAVQRNSWTMAESWKRQLRPDEVARIFDVWQQFDVPLYRDADNWRMDRQSPSETTDVRVNV